jgi:protein MpaA
MTGRRVLRSVTVLLVAIASIGALVATSDSDGRRPVAAGARTKTGRARAQAQARGRARDPLIRRRVLLGKSVDGRAIVAVALGDPDAPRKLLVVGVIHGNETAGMAIARKLASGPPPPQALLWVVRDLNPDGVAAGTRQNARGVDLNRNFPWHWRPIEGRGSLQYPGPRALSEPEARVARALILRVRPRITIWFHQPLGLVDESGGNVRIERRYAHQVGLPPARLTRYRGSAINWQNRNLPGSTAFAVELPPGKLSPALLGRNVRAVRRFAG